MTKLKPGIFVYWKTGPRAHPLKMTGHIVSINCETAQVRANGEVYEVKIEYLRWRGLRYPRPACTTCGQPCQTLRATCCSRECFYELNRRRCVERVFAVLVAYKAAHNGISPIVPQIVRLARTTNEGARDALRRLEADGRIWFEGDNRHRQIGVVGGKWVYERG